MVFNHIFTDFYYPTRFKEKAAGRESRVTFLWSSHGAVLRDGQSACEGLPGSSLTMTQYIINHIYVYIYIMYLHIVIYI